MGEKLKTALLLCGDWGHGVELARGATDEGMEVHVVPGLCGRPGEIDRLLAGAGVARLVLGLCPEEYSLAEMQAQARKLGLDALGVEVVHLRGLGPEKAGVLLAAAVARARAYAGSKPENARPYLSPRMSRRSLFRLSLSEYRAVPSVERRMCAADLGCKACVDVCPRTALEWSDGQVGCDKLKCEPCGLCTTACPRGAMVDPTYTPAQLEAQVRALLPSGHSGAHGILFTCRRHPEPKTPEGWMPVVLPCIGMAPPTWLLAPLVMGARAVRVMPCSRGCSVGQSEAVDEKVDFSQRFLRLAGAPERLVAFSPALDQSPLESERRSALEDHFSLEAPARVLLEVAREFGAKTFALQHPGSPLGVVEVMGDVCTGCGSCAMSCPTGALALEKTSEGVALTFDDAACTACGLCLSRCPERDAITLSRAVDLARLRQGRARIYQDETARCEGCGARIATTKMMERVRALLGGEQVAVLDVVTRYCPACRGIPASHDRGI